VVTSVLQTTAGRMIFGRHAEPPPAASGDTGAGKTTDRPDRNDRDDTGRRPRPAAQA
jgi:hypothetical protein